jgi:hypothetical protein
MEDGDEWQADVLLDGFRPFGRGWVAGAALPTVTYLNGEEIP